MCRGRHWVSLCPALWSVCGQVTDGEQTIPFAAALSGGHLGGTWEAMCSLQLPEHLGLPGVPALLGAPRTLTLTAPCPVAEA